jgi:hypothetical protein
MGEIVLVLHGPFIGNCYERIAASVSRACAKGEARFDRMIVSTYHADAARTQRLLKTQCPSSHFELLSGPDIAIPGFYNVNRHVYLVNRALQVVAAESFVVKLRNDQCVNFSKLGRLLASLNYLRDATDRIVTTNCYTRADRLYHPSDMFLCGTRLTLSEYFSLPYQHRTHMDSVLAIAHQHGTSPMKALPGAPEELLFRNYLTLKGWKCGDTQADSLAAIRRYCHVINTWDIDMTWTKRRTPFRRAGTVILPYFFRQPPFPGGPLESARCWSRHEVEGVAPTAKDLFFLGLSRCLWAVAGNKLRETDYFRTRLRKLRGSLAKRWRRLAASLLMT